MGNLADLTVRIGADDKDLDKGLSGAESKVTSFADKLGKAAKVAGGVAGAAGGAALMAGFATNLETETASRKLEAQLGGQSPLFEAAGQAAGNLYANAYGSSLGEVNEAVKTVLQSGAVFEEVTSEQLESITGKALSLSQTFDQDLGGTMRAVGQIVRTGLAPDAEAAMDILARGFQQGNDKAGDLLDTFNEYSTQFRKLGLDGQTAMGLITQGLREGARDADIVADSIKEFSIRAIDGSKSTTNAFRDIGLNAEDMAAKIAAGGPSASAALQLTLDKLRAMKDPVTQSAAAVGLFGTQAEDLGKALLALDPSKAVADLGQVKGAIEGVDKTIGDTAQNKITVMQRAVEKWTASLASSQGPLGDTAAAVMAFGGPATQYTSQLALIAVSLKGLGLASVLSGAQAVVSTTAAAAVVVAKWIWMGTVATLQAGRTALAWLIGFVAGSALAVATMTLTAAAVVAQWVIMAAGATARALVMAGAWVVGFVAGSAMALAATAVTATAVVAQWVVMAAGATARALVMAAAWFIALGPIGWATAAVVGIVALIIANWDRVKAFTVAAWNAISAAVNSAVSGVLGFFGRLPGQILGALGDLGSLLYNAGSNIVQGLWNGILSLGGWLKSKILGFIKSFVPGPVLQYLGIASPSKLFEGIGSNVAAGLAGGITGGEGLVASAAARLASSATASFTPVTVRSAATAGAALAAPAGVAAIGGARLPPIEIRSDGSRLGDLLVELLRKSIRGLGGDVQGVLGS